MYCNTLFQGIIDNTIGKIIFVAPQIFPHPSIHLSILNKLYSSKWCMSGLYIIHVADHRGVITEKVIYANATVVPSRKRFTIRMVYCASSN